jgi:hypothetical protein
MTDGNERTKIKKRPLPMRRKGLRHLLMSRKYLSWLLNDEIIIKGIFIYEHQSNKEILDI